MHTQDMGNNEQVSRGMKRLNDGRFVVLTFSESKTLNTERGAINWLARRGFNPDGTEIPEAAH